MADDADVPMKPPSAIAVPAPGGEGVIPRDPRTGTIKRGRGRPPGSRNKPKEQPPASPAKLVFPSGGNRNPPSSGPINPDDDKAKREQKKAKAEEYAAYINNELNDKLMMLIIGMSRGAIPAEVLFVSGKVPPKAATNPAYTEIGNAFAIPADVADAWGKLFAELSDTNMGKSVTKITGNQNTGLLFAAVAAIYSTFRYYQQLKPQLDMLKKLQEETAKRVAEQQEGSNE